MRKKQGQTSERCWTAAGHDQHAGMCATFSLYASQHWHVQTFAPNIHIMPNPPLCSSSEMLEFQGVEWCTFTQGCQCKFSLCSLKASFEEAGPSCMLCDIENHLETNASPIFSDHTSVTWKPEASCAHTVNTRGTSWASWAPFIRISFACLQIMEFLDKEEVLC